jgi:hypothetical protein
MPCLIYQFRYPSSTREEVFVGLGVVSGFLNVALGLVIGVFLAGVLGGISRWVARRHEADMLTIFFGGTLGAIGLLLLAWFFNQFILRTILIILGWPEGFYSTYAVLFISPLVGLWWGMTLVARFIQRGRRR